MSETPLKTLGKYQIQQELGKGAMGVVYLGFDPALERKVALKVMASAIVSDNELKERFEREAKSVAKLQHPNIVTVYDLGYDAQGAPYIAMEYLKGQDLEQRIRRDPLTFREKLDVVAQTCRGLSHAHKNGIVHRDIKPANVFITEGGEAKIMDFGVARWQQSSHTQTGAVLGTADYMSPEQIRGQKVDGRSDIFSVGVILYRLLTNKKPFAGENIQSVFFKVLNQEPPELVLPDGNSMPELQAIVDKALSKNVDERYADADDLAEDIRDLVSMYRDVLNEDTVFDTMFDPAAAGGPGVEEPGSDGSGRKKTSSTGRVLGGTSPSGGSRTHRPGTAYPTTSTGKTASGRTAPGRTVAGRTVAGSPTRMMPRAQTGVSQAGSVGIPYEEPTSAWKYILAVALFLGIGGGIYWFTQIRNPPDVAATTVTTPSTPQGPTLEEKLATVRRAIDGGLLAAASNDVEQILLGDPTNAEALALKAEIDAAQQKAQQPAQVTQAPPPATSPDVPRGPSRSEQASKLAVDASMAMGRGSFDEAEAFIREGRQLDPANPAWQQLSQQIAEARQNSARAAELRERQAVIDGYVTQAAEHMKSRNYTAAITEYDKALQHDPSNVQLITLRNSAEVAIEQQRAAAVRALQIEEGRTEYVPPPGGPEGPKGFEAGGVQVQQATKAPDNPGELIVQIRPETVQLGDPYDLLVRIHNQGNKPIGVKSVELISTFGSKTTGKGQPLTPLVQRINARDTSVIFQTRGTWSEDQRQGSIEAVVTLIGDAKLRKTIRWQ
jgi:serine/threonine protein kinase/tetratricopeptide (TPR) repeat protein